jgi:superfamily II DNA or RNA helicase
MLAVLRDNQWINLEHLTDYEESTIWNAFSVARPGVYIDPGQRNWDGIYRKFNRAKRRLARPYLSRLRDVCEQNKLSLDIDDQRPDPQFPCLSPADITPDFLPGITLEDYQIAAIQKGCELECGIFLLPTSAGKTEIAAGIVKAHSCPCMILAAQTVVIDQIKARLELRDVAGEIGLFYAGKRPDGQMVVVGTIQSLTPAKKPEEPVRSNYDTEDNYKRAVKRYEKSKLAYNTRRANLKYILSYMKSAEMLVVDEADTASSKVWRDTMRFYFRGRYRYGFTGTLATKERPVESMHVEELLGGVVFRVDRELLLERKRIVPVNYRMLAVGVDGDKKDASTYDIAHREWIEENVEFHELIAGLCTKLVTAQNGVLIIVDKELLGHNLMRAINNVGIGSDFIYGKTAKRARRVAIEKFEKRELRVLIGGKIINRGLDLRGGCEHLINCTSLRLTSDLLQKIGRAFRLNQSGKATIWDIYHMGNRYLYDHARAKLKAMVNANFETKVFFPGGPIAGQLLVEKRFRIPPHLLMPPPR